ncbi:MAG: hypothetical protein KKB51_03510 [Candidatus Riflebacteria bacterium]|nr:hypothetical protein [Candidatus Riflebacteria bacterium]
MAKFDLIKTALVLLCFLLILPGLQAVDIFAWLEMPERPISISDPDWAQRGSRLRLEFDVHEYYKRWVDDRLVNDFSGKSSRAELSLQLLPDFAVGARKKFAEPQTWENNSNDKSARFTMNSETEAGDVFMRFSRESFVLEVGGGSGKSYFAGDYDLHPDIVNALGKNPPIFLNTGETRRYAKFFGRYKCFKLDFELNETKYTHVVTASTPAMDLVLNHDRSLQQKSVELSWEESKVFSPYLRFDKYQDNGSGENFKDARFKFGNNRSGLDIEKLSLGGVYRFRNTSYFAEYSRMNFDVNLETDINLITLNPIFLFGTNRVAYRMDFCPDAPWALRLGAQRCYRGIECFAQYSYTSLSGVSTVWSQKEYNMFANVSTENTLSDTTLDLHRLALCLNKPDTSGRWQVKLNLLVPLAESVEQKATIPPAPGPAPQPQPAGSKLEESIRGGWQIIIAREFLL